MNNDLWPVLLPHDAKIPWQHEGILYTQPCGHLNMGQEGVAFFVEGNKWNLTGLICLF